MTQTSKPKRKALGRGLGALIPKQGAETEARTFFMCPIDDIDPARLQPRQHFDDEALDELTTSIAETGLLQPLVVRQLRDRYELIAGERRLRACKRAGLTEVPVVAREVSDAQAFALALVENIQREDLNPIEEAMAFERLLEDFDVNQSELANQVGRSRSAISNSLRLLTLGEAIIEMVRDGDLSAGHARCLVGLDEDVARALALEILDEGLSVRATEERVRALRQADDAPAEAPATARGSAFRDDAGSRALVDRLRSRLGTKVALKDRHGKGRLEIHYDSYDVLQNVLDQLGVALDDEP